MSASRESPARRRSWPELAQLRETSGQIEVLEDADVEIVRSRSSPTEVLATEALS
jgi:hypothetical protein